MEIVQGGVDSRWDSSSEKVCQLPQSAIAPVNTFSLRRYRGSPIGRPGPVRCQRHNSMIVPNQ